MVSGTVVSFTLASVCCFDANILVILAEVLITLFCKGDAREVTVC